MTQINFLKDGTISLAGISFQKMVAKAYLAYNIQRLGSDWRKVIVIETENKNIIGDTLLDIKFSGINWG